MKMFFADVSSVVPELTVWSLLARLCPGELRNNEHLSNRSSPSQPCEGQHEDMVLTKQESCKLMARIMRVVE
jgi:hypothetical protein